MLSDRLLELDVAAERLLDEVLLIADERVYERAFCERELAILELLRMLARLCVSRLTVL